MPLPDFDVNNLLPSGVHFATEAEVKERCVDPFPTSVTRSQVFDGLCNYRRDIEALGFNVTQWVDGSFTDRSRLDPEDIDLVNYLKANEVNSIPAGSRDRVRALLNGREGTKTQYLCHTFLEFVFPLGHPLEPFAEKRRKEWRKFWATPQDYSNPAVKTPAPHRGNKGIIEMKIGDAARAPAIDSTL